MRGCWLTASGGDIYTHAPSSSSFFSVHSHFLCIIPSGRPRQASCFLCVFRAAGPGRRPVFQGGSGISFRKANQGKRNLDASTHLAYPYPITVCCWKCPCPVPGAACRRDGKRTPPAAGRSPVVRFFLAPFRKCFDCPSIVAQEDGV